MAKTLPSSSPGGGLLTFQPWSRKVAGQNQAAPGEGAHAYLIEVQGEEASRVPEAVVPVLDRLLQEKSARVRDEKLAQLVDVMTAQMVVPSVVDVRMAQRVAQRQARVLNEFGYATAEELAELGGSQAANRHALADNWKKRRQVFGVRHRDAAGRPREVYPLFQLRDGRPLKVIQQVLEAFGPDKDPWKLALWFASNNGSLPEQARPVDLLEAAPQAVVEAAQRDAGAGAAA